MNRVTPLTALATELDELWSALENWTRDLASTPTSMLALDRLSRIVRRCNEIGAGAAAVLAEARASRDQLVATAHRTLRDTAELNAEVGTASAVPAELLRRRDRLADDAAALLGARCTVQPDGTLTVHQGTTALVQDRTSATLSVVGDDVHVDGTRLPPGSLRGSIGSLQEVVVDHLPRLLRTLDHAAARLADSINAKHAAHVSADGTTGARLLIHTARGAAATLTVATTEPARQTADATARAVPDQQDLELEEAILELRVQEVVYAATLGSLERPLPQSLVSFLR